jgi:hypothetical protein
MLQDDRFEDVLRRDLRALARNITPNPNLTEQTIARRRRIRWHRRLTAAGATRVVVAALAWHRPHATVIRR